MKDKSQKSEPLKTIQSRTGIAGYFIVFLVGVTIGCAVTFFWLKSNKQSYKTDMGTEFKPQQLSTTNKFINPSAVNPEYKKYDLHVIHSIQTKTEAKTQKLITEKKATTIAIYFRDLTNDNWFGINETELFAPASLLKVPVMIGVLKYADEQPDILQRKMTYEGRKEHLHTAKNISEVTTGTTLIRGHEYTLDRLLDIMIMDSDNEATILLLDFLNDERPGFLEKVQSELGTDVPQGVREKDDFITVRRYSSFFRTLYNASYLSDKMSEKALNILSKAGYGYGIRQAIPKNIKVCHKYGHKDVDLDHQQLHHFGIVYHPKKPFLIGIMTKGRDMQQLKEVVASITRLVYEEIDGQTKGNQSYLERDVE